MRTTTIIRGLLKSTRKTLVKNAPQIATGLGVTTMVITVVLAVKQTPKAMRIIEKEEEKKGESLTKPEIVKTTWKEFVPVAVSGCISAALIIGGQRASIRRNAALAAAYSLSEKALNEYRDKNIELFGEKKDKEIMGGIASDKLKETPTPVNDVLLTGKGDHLCFDTLSGRYFRANISYIERVENIMNKRLISEMYISLNDLYRELGLSTIEIGDDLGWNVNKDLISIDFSAVPDVNGEPCIVLEYHIKPRIDYEDNY